MIFNGLANLSKATGDTRYLESAKKAADFCIQYQTEEGLIAAQISGESLMPVDTTKTWSTQTGAFHAKLAIGLLNIYDQTQDSTYKKSAELLCEYALGFQQADGQFYTYGTLKSTNLHPHAYAAEGLYVAGQYLNNDRYTRAASLATEWAMTNVKNGLVPRHKHGSIFNYNERVDILSQVYRLAILFPGVTEIESRQLLANHILKYQYFGENKEQHGGFIFGKLSDGSVAEHINCWVTQFALQALLLADGKKLNNIFHLV
jgi:rhamnogalacturonyl hydrolase YesR